VHHRRQRGRERGRAALPQVRRHAQPHRRVTVILPSGEIVSLGSPDGETGGYDLLGAFIGSEGCFGVALDVTVRLARNPQAVRTLLADFTSLDAAARATSAIVATGSCRPRWR
jgi:FAD/FMN-containing dehydrogenase